MAAFACTRLVRFALPACSTVQQRARVLAALRALFAGAQACEALAPRHLPPARYQLDDERGREFLNQLDVGISRICCGLAEALKASPGLAGSDAGAELMAALSPEAVHALLGHAAQVVAELQAAQGE